MDGRGSVGIREAREGDAAQWLRMRNRLWPPQDGDEHEADIARFFAGDVNVICAGGGAAAVFVAERDGGRLGGFVEVGVRPFAEGCDTRPVGFIEGWFVDEDLRLEGVGAELVRAAESWARAEGCTEMA